MIAGGTIARTGSAGETIARAGGAGGTRVAEEACIGK